MKKGKTVTIGLLLLIAVMLLSAWQDITGNTINPRYVERIKNGQTTKNEIMILFGEPQQVNRTTDGVVFVYRSYRDAPVLRNAILMTATLTLNLPSHSYWTKINR